MSETQLVPSMDTELVQTFLAREKEAEGRERALMKRIAELERANAKLEAQLELERERVALMANSASATNLALAEAPSAALRARAKAAKKRNVELMVEVRELKLQLADKDAELGEAHALIASMDFHGVSQRANIAMLETALRHPGARPLEPLLAGGASRAEARQSNRAASSPTASTQASASLRPPAPPSEEQVLALKIELEGKHRAALLDIQGAYEHLLARAKAKIKTAQMEKSTVVSQLASRQQQLEMELVAKRQLMGQLEASTRTIRSLKSLLFSIHDQMELKLNQAVNLRSHLAPRVPFERR